MLVLFAARQVSVGVDFALFLFSGSRWTEAAVELARSFLESRRRRLRQLEETIVRNQRARRTNSIVGLLSFFLPLLQL